MLVVRRRESQSKSGLVDFPKSPEVFCFVLRRFEIPKD
jgi:hypothetical protein